VRPFSSPYGASGDGSVCRAVARAVPSGRSILASRAWPMPATPPRRRLPAARRRASAPRPGQVLLVSRGPRVRQGDPHDRWILPPLVVTYPWMSTRTGFSPADRIPAISSRTSFRTARPQWQAGASPAAAARRRRESFAWPAAFCALTACLLAVARSARNASTGRLPPTMQIQAGRTKEQNGGRAAVPGFIPDLPGQRWARAPRCSHYYPGYLPFPRCPDIAGTAPALLRIAGAAVRSLSCGSAWSV
jgi:hypothetical protein